MVRTLTIENSYDAPVEAVAALMSDPAFRAAVSERQHPLSHREQIEGTEVLIVQTHPTRHLPAVARPFVGEHFELRRTESWDPTFTHADVMMWLTGAPGKVTGTVAIEPREGGCVQTVELVCRVGVALVGGRIEELTLAIGKWGYAKERDMAVRFLR